MSDERELQMRTEMRTDMRTDMQTVTARPVPRDQRHDCPPPEHPKLTAFLEAMAMAGAIWDMTGALMTQAMRRQYDDDCNKGGTR